MNCDICNKEISSREIVKIPIKEMQQAVHGGFNPFKTRGIDMSLATGLTGMFGLSTAEFYQDWRQRVLADTTDWGLCPACTKAFRNATKPALTPAGERSTPKQSGSSAPSKKTQAEAQYQAIITRCEASQNTLDTRRAEIELTNALAESEPYKKIWQEYSKQHKEPVELKEKNFSGMLFKNAEFRRHTFLHCDFRASRWVFSIMKNCDCTSSNFSEFHIVMWPFQKTNCSNCNFTNVKAKDFDPFFKNNYENANFTDAELEIGDYKFRDDTLPTMSRFDNAIMDGCKLTVKIEERSDKSKAEIKSYLDKMFSPAQLSVMHVEIEGGRPETEAKKSSGGGVQSSEEKKSGCFIATAACGVNSAEVMTLRQFRDNVLLNSASGRLFTRIYYAISPTLASLIEDSPRWRYLVRNLFVRPAARLVGKRKN